ncbi:MAG: hypothetical protein IKS32_04575 [Solobacterium sp.]|nr:hypothetical protein [Solobacterium sp.]
MSESTKRVSGRQTAGQAVIKFLRGKGATDEAHAVGYDELKNIRLTTQVLAYTIANMMEEKVIIRTEDDRYYFSEAGWAKLERKVLGSYSILFIIPLIGALIVWLVTRAIG